jgi:RNA polymerase sigma factor (sigma-70 family)
MATGQPNTVLQFIRKMATTEHGRGLADAELLDRFMNGDDDAAFASLVHRHGPMVLGICRRILMNEEDAEDAFQATFLTLSRNAKSIRAQESVGGWLYSVAYRIAHKARIEAARRRKHEGSATLGQMSDPLAQLTVREAHEVLDRELAQLPDKLRVPLVLCYLEGLTRDEAARQLGWSPTMLKTRLEQARERLRKRLQSRGLAFSGALVASLFYEGTAWAAVPSTLLESTLKIAAPGATELVVPAQVAALTEGVMKTMFLTNLKIATAVLVLVAVVATGASIARLPVLAAEPPQPPKAEQPAASAADKPKAGVKPVVVKEENQLISVAWSADGKTVATVGIRSELVELADGEKALMAHSTIKIRDAKTGEL